MAGIDYSERIPNNVSLADNRRLQRALEEWHPKFLDWWMQMGPDGFQAKDGSNRANGRDITFPDGKKLFVGSTGTGAPDEKKERR